MKKISYHNIYDNLYINPYINLCINLKSLTRIIFYFIFILSINNIYANKGAEQNINQNAKQNTNQSANILFTNFNKDFALNETYFYDQYENKKYIVDFEGKVILLVFWSNLIINYKEMLYKLDNLQKDFNKLPFQIILIAENYHNTKKIKQIFNKLDIKYLNIYYDRNFAFFKSLGDLTMPCSFLIDANSYARKQFINQYAWHKNQIRKMIFSYIEGIYMIPRNSYKVKNFIQMQEI